MFCQVFSKETSLLLAMIFISLNALPFKTSPTTPPLLSSPPLLKKRAYSNSLSSQGPSLSYKSDSPNMDDSLSSLDFLDDILPLEKFDDLDAVSADFPVLKTPVETFDDSQLSSDSQLPPPGALDLDESNDGADADNDPLDSSLEAPDALYQGIPMTFTESPSTSGILDYSRLGKINSLLCKAIREEVAVETSSGNKLHSASQNDPSLNSGSFFSDLERSFEAVDIPYLEPVYSTSLDILNRLGLSPSFKSEGDGKEPETVKPDTQINFTTAKKTAQKLRKKENDNASRRKRKLHAKSLLQGAVDGSNQETVEFDSQMTQISGNEAAIKEAKRKQRKNELDRVSRKKRIEAMEDWEIIARKKRLRGWNNASRKRRNEVTSKKPESEERDDPIYSKSFEILNRSETSPANKAEGDDEEQERYLKNVYSKSLEIWNRLEINPAATIDDDQVPVDFDAQTESTAAEEDIARKDRRRRMNRASAKKRKDKKRQGMDENQLSLIRKETQPRYKLLDGS
jgi:hypothetical protein